VLVLRSVDGLGGGAEAIILRTAARLDPQRVRMTVCCIHRHGDAAYDFDRRAAELGIDYCGVAQHSILAGGVLAAIREIAAQRRAQIVDAQDYKAAFFASRLAGSGGIIPAATLHGWSGRHWRERLVYYPAERILVRRFPLAIAVSGQIRNTLVRWRCQPECVQVLPNGIDPVEFRRNADARRRIRTSLGIAAGDVVLGAVGRIEQEKRFDVLLEAMASLLPRRPELRLAIVGEGSLKPRLHDQMRRLGIADRCRLVGHRQDVVDLYQAFDVFVQSSDREGSPTVVVEAMAMEVPLVATEVGGTRELVQHEMHGLLVPRRDPLALADAVEQTLQTPDLTARRVAAARARVVNDLSFDARTRRLERMYLDLVEQQQSSPRL
jgi:glycosyltransferase involved in cell wall biosynthesis